MEVINSYANIEALVRLCDDLLHIFHAHVACGDTVVIQLALGAISGHVSKLIEC